MEDNQQQTTHSSTKKKILVIAISIVVLLAGGILLYGFMQNPLLIGNKQATPDESTFYLAKKQQDSVLFYRYPDLLVDHKNPPRTVGHFAAYEKPFDITTDPNEFVDYRALQDQKKLFTFEGHPIIENYVISNDKKYLLLSFLGGKNDMTNYIYQIDLQSLASKKIWEHELRSGQTPYNEGFAYVTHFIPNQYIVFAMIKSTPPPDALPEGVVIKNLTSGKETVLGVVGDVTIDEKQKTVSFKKLEKTQVPCEKNDPVCFATDTYKYAYKPGGDDITQPLP